MVALVVKLGNGPLVVKLGNGLLLLLQNQNMSYAAPEP